MAKRSGTDEVAESRRIIGQIQQESGYGRPVRRLRDHLHAADADPSDPIETWGTRIGRGIGFVVTVTLVILFIRYLASA